MDNHTLKKILDTCHLSEYMLGHGIMMNWEPSKEAMIPGSFKVRSPTKKYPYSYLRHIRTIKYKRLLLYFNPSLFFKAAHFDQIFLTLTSSPEDALVAAVTEKLL
jgi:hypothetical protein